MDPAAIAGVLLATAAGVLLATVALAVVWTGTGAATSMIGGLFGHPDLGWPAGVQEDDEARWDWAVRPDPVEARPFAEASEPASAAPERLVPTLRRGPTR